MAAIIDPQRLQRWMNIRKLTPTMLAARAGLADATVRELLAGSGELSAPALEQLAAVLAIPAARLLEARSLPRLIVHRRAQIEGTRRPIVRDGIHFYNYYSLPTPEGFVAPVILDILCPPTQLPALNNGHLEPAITLNLGPGDIHGRWAEELSEDSWQVLEANPDPDARFITGASYVEPCYRPHSYSLVRAEDSARIVSYTAFNELTTLLEHTRRWGPEPFAAMVEAFGERADGAALLTMSMHERGLTRASLARAAELPEPTLARFLAGEDAALGLAELEAVAAVLGLDYRLLLRPRSVEDRLGKTHCSAADSRASIREFGRYRVADMARASRFSDLSGLFMCVEDPGPAVLDLLTHGPAHYLVTQSQLELCWRGAEGLERLELEAGDALWLAPFVAHGFSGAGALARFSSGEGFGVEAWRCASLTFELPATLHRGRTDAASWGYDD